jgi:hypothetical protein
MSRSNISTNRNARINSREDRKGNIRTETVLRDEGAMLFAASTNPRTNATSVFIDFPEGALRLTGAEARTMYRLLHKHYSATNKSR